MREGARERVRPRVREWVTEGVAVGGMEWRIRDSISYASTLG